MRSVLRKIRKRQTVASRVPSELRGSEVVDSNPGSSDQGPNMAGDYGLKTVYESESPKVDIVFIHGLDGHWRASFTQDNVFWPSQYLPHDVEDIRILSFGYDARVISKSPISKTVYNHAEALVGDLVRLRRETKALILSHNATSAHLPEYRSIKLSTYGVCFFGTPQQGVDGTSIPTIALNVASLYSHTNTKYYSLLRRNSEWLQEQCSMYLAITMDFTTKCFWEKQETEIIAGLSKMIVPKYSVSLPGSVNHENIGFDRDHVNLVKFTKKDDDYHTIIRVIRQLAQEAGPKVNENWLKERNTVEIGTDVPFEVPFSKDQKFVFREELQSESSETSRWLSGVTDRSTHARLALHGRGGTGKTALANEIAHRIHVDSPETAVFWVSAASRARFEQDYMRLAQLLGVPGSDSPQADRMRVVSNWLNRSTMGPWVLILDNADDSLIFCNPDKTAANGEDLRQYIPQTPQGAVLVTTKNMKAAVAICDPDNIVDIPEMTNQESLLLLRKRLGEKYATDPRAHELLDCLEHLPQAVTQACAFMTYNTIKCAEYLELFNNPKKQANLMDEAYADLRRDSEIPNSVVATGILSFQQIQKEDPKAAEIMSLISVIDRQRIPQSLLDEFTGYGRMESMKAMGMLKGFKLLVPHEDGQMYDMHRLVHITLQAWLRSTGLLASWQQKAVKLLARVFPTAYFENWDLCSSYLHHADAVLVYSAEGDPTRRHQRVAILAGTGSYMIERGIYCPNTSRLEEALLEVEDILGPDHQETLEITNFLAVALREQGKYDRSEKLFLRAVASGERLYGTVHVTTIRSMSEYGCLLHILRRLQEAKSMLERALEAAIQLYGSDHELTMAVTGRLADVLYAQANYSEARRLTQRAIDCQKDVYGERHPAVLAKMHNMAKILAQTGDCRRAETLYKRIIQLQEDVLGVDDYHTLLTRSDLAMSVYYRDGRYKDAVEIQRRVLKNLETSLGPDHPDAIINVHNLAICLRGWAGQTKNIGLLYEAESLLRKAVSATELVLGPSNDHTLSSISSLALVLDDLGEQDKAQDMLSTQEGDFYALDPATQAYTLHTQPALDPPAGQQPNFDNPPNGSAAVAVLFAICLALATVGFTARVYTRFFCTREKALVDYLLILAYVIILVSFSFIVRDLETPGLFVLQYDVRLGDFIAIPKDIFIVEQLNTVALCLLKRAIWKLHMTTPKKLSVSVIFAIGLLACVSTVIRSVETVLIFSSTDVMHGYSVGACLGAAELTCGFLTITVPSIPQALSSIRSSKLLTTARLSFWWFSKTKRKIWSSYAQEKKKSNVSSDEGYFLELSSSHAGGSSYEMGNLQSRRVIVDATKHQLITYERPLHGGLDVESGALDVARM
ncbi:hypothetical protein PG996_000021 [Apiospora saccharicola]|uniref:AAA+ ATPase domain-containing protein n=1 Tax=Apiospora saccharicola TaxID=335842 RepID=A0ABR1WCL2_9PEZI